MEPQGTERKEDPSEQYAEGGEDTVGAETGAETEAGAETETETRADTEAGIEADIESESESGSESESESESESDSESESESEAGAEPEAEEDEGDPLLRETRLKGVLESLLFASEKPLPLKRMGELTGTRDKALLQATFDSLVADYEGRGIVLCEVAGGWQFRTAAANSEWVQQLVGGRPVRLSRAQLETMAIVAYRQPITRPEIDDIRGVDSGGTLKVLLDRSLIRVLGKKEEPGRPLLYGSTKEFLEFFNLSDLRELPTLREYHELTEDSMRMVERMGMSLDDLPGKGTIAAEGDEGEVSEEPTEEAAAEAGEESGEESGEEAGGAETAEAAAEESGEEAAEAPEEGTGEAEAPEEEEPVAEAGEEFAAADESGAESDVTGEVADEVPAAPETDPLREAADASSGDEVSVESSAEEPETASENAPARSDNGEDEAL